MIKVEIVKIQQELDIVMARQKGREMSKLIGFGAVDQARITTAVSELARNIYLYAGTGEITFEPIEENNKIGVKISAIDKGPGIEDIKKALEDGYTTSGGLGAGVPGVKRLMDEFFIDSTVGVGTTVIVKKWHKK
ncbi:serine/threonine-protein kinase RsbT [Peribacillus deserti]|uniref:Serine/threonine-protein kinase RsbT n=1 Tax=Peribacillus deserti TaxID=673318 RepID=A0ABS2QH86_9BACI|nr:anti-sigma regulatory factor [Peribacillus deserti]MBM7692472.1 serine/threonine-protein kinase RsbT [Peribacillus deserti]